MSEPEKNKQFVRRILFCIFVLLIFQLLRYSILLANDDVGGGIMDIILQFLTLKSSTNIYCNQNNIFNTRKKNEFHSMNNNCNKICTLTLKTSIIYLRTRLYQHMLIGTS